MSKFEKQLSQTSIYSGPKLGHTCFAIAFFAKLEHLKVSNKRTLVIEIGRETGSVSHDSFL